MKRLGKAILKLVLELGLFIIAIKTVDFVTNLFPWATPILLVLGIVSVIAIYYFEDKEDRQ